MIFFNYFGFWGSATPRGRAYSEPEGPYGEPRIEPGSARYKKSTLSFVSQVPRKIIIDLLIWYIFGLIIFIIQQE